MSTFILLSLGLLAADELPSDSRAASNDDKELIANLVELLKDPDEKVRVYASTSLTSLDRRAVPALIDLLKGEDKKLRAEAAKILGSMGTHGRRHTDALPALTKRLKDDDVEVRRWAAYAISQIVVPPQ